MSPARRPLRRSALRRLTVALVGTVVVASCSSAIEGAAQRAPGLATGVGQTTARGLPPSITVPSTGPATGPGSTAARPTTAPTTIGPPAPIPAGLARFYAQQLGWTGCTSFATTDGDRQYLALDGLDCAYVTVPLTYADPAAGSVKVAILRKKATGPKVGSVVMDPGGPGGSGVVFMAQLAGAGVTDQLGQSFDLIGFDPRGVGSSLPAITCRTDAERDAERAANFRGRTAAEVAAADQLQQQEAEHCAERTGQAERVDGKTFLGSIGTRDVAKDLDVVRAALGDQKLTYLGFSYGTQIGWVYAEQFAGNVRAMVLDGALDPNQAPADSLIEQGRGFQTAFTDFTNWCAKQANCVLGADTSKSLAVYQSLARALLDNPIKLADGRLLTFRDMNTGTVQALYSESLWPGLLKGLLAVSQGDGSAMMALADSYEERDAKGHYGKLLDAFGSITCMDNPLVDDATAQATAREFFKVAPFQDPGDPLFATKTWCNYWPAKPTLAPHKPVVSGLPTVLVISTTHDPATPYQAGVDLAKDLGARLLTVEGTRHTAYLGAGVTCVDDLATKYLVTLELPPAVTKCS